jgi:hypothetical protein
VKDLSAGTRNVVENAIDAQRERKDYRNMSTPETRRFWEHAERCAAKVATWPEWKKGGVVLPSEKP